MILRRMWIETKTSRKENNLILRRKTLYYGYKNYSQGLRIYYQSLRIYYQGLVINYQSLRIVFARGITHFKCSKQIFYLIAFTYSQPFYH